MSVEGMPRDAARLKFSDKYVLLDEETFARMSRKRAASAGDVARHPMPKMATAAANNGLASMQATVRNPF